MRIQQISELEEKVLMAIIKLGEDAYGANVRETLVDAGRKISIGAFYVTLDRMEQKGYIEGYEGLLASTRGGKPRRYFKVTGIGRHALEDNDRVLSNLRVHSLRGAA